MAICFLVSPVSQAKQSIALLKTFLQETKTIQADFQQKLLDHQGLLLQQSAGVFKLKRPGKFYWDYLVPFPQKIISNGHKIWVYDEELEQVSVKKYSQMLAGSPVILLDQNKDLNEDFIIEDKGFSNNQYWLTLTPIKKEKEFKMIEVGMTVSGMQTMKLHDGFDQVTIIEFKKLKSNEDLNDDQFFFKVPEGTDVVGDF